MISGLRQWWFLPLMKKTLLRQSLKYSVTRLPLEFCKIASPDILSESVPPLDWKCSEVWTLFDQDKIVCLPLQAIWYLKHLGRVSFHVYLKIWGVHACLFYRRSRAWVRFIPLQTKTWALFLPFWPKPCKVITMPFWREVFLDHNGQRQGY